MYYNLLQNWQKPTFRTLHFCEVILCYEQRRYYSKQDILTCILYSSCVKMCEFTFDCYTKIATKSPKWIY